MKKIISSMMAILFASVSAMAQCTTLSGTLSANKTLDASTCYHLEGCFVVPTGKVLTIPAGTQILCASESNLIVEQGGKLNAIGTAASPIVFTSDQPVGSRTSRHWGGLVILGYAPNNESSNAIRKVCVNRTFGGNIDNDNSGTLQYIRIEYAGSSTDRDEPAGLLLASIGSGTTIDHIQVSECSMDGFLSLGGTYNAKYLLSHNAAQTGYRFSLGYTGSQQFLLGLVTDPNVHVSSSYSTNGVYMDNDHLGSANLPLTNPLLSNITVLYPIYCGTTLPSSDFKNGITFNKNAAGSIRNSAFAGAKGYGMEILDVASVSNTANNLLNFSSNAIMSSGGTGDFFTPISWATGCGGSLSSMAKWINGTGLVSCRENGNSFTLSSFGYNATLCGDFCNTRPTITHTGTNLDGTDFSSPFNAFFTNVNYKGAIGLTDWTAPWASFCPQKETYCSCTSPMPKTLKTSTIQFVPNPSDGMTTAHFTADAVGIAQLYVLDKVTGAVLSKTNIKIAEPGKQRISFSVKGLKEDVYSIRIEMKNTVLTGKLLVK